MKNLIVINTLVIFTFSLYSEENKILDLSEKDLLQAKVIQETVGRNIINALRQGRFLFAETEWKKIENSPIQEAEYHYLKGILLYSRLEWSDAKANFIKALVLDSNHEAAAFSLGMTYAQEDQWAKAKQSWSQALDLSPYNPFYYYNIGVAHFVLGEWDKTIVSLKKAEEFKPNYYESKSLLAQAYLESGDWEEAVKTLQSILETEPKNDKANNVMGRAIYLNSHDSKKALLFLKNERILGWRDKKIYARCYAELRNWKKAESILRYVAYSPFADSSDEELYLNILLSLGWEEKANEYFRFAENKGNQSSALASSYRKLLSSHEGKFLLYHYYKTR